MDTSQKVTTILIILLIPLSYFSIQYFTNPREVVVETILPDIHITSEASLPDTSYKVVIDSLSDRIVSLMEYIDMLERHGVEYSTPFISTKHFKFDEGWALVESDVIMYAPTDKIVVENDISIIPISDNIKQIMQKDFKKTYRKGLRRGLLYGIGAVAGLYLTYSIVNSGR